MQKYVLLILAGLALSFAACAPIPTASSNLQQASLEANEFKYQPATIEVEAGRPVKITLNNKGTIEHDWSIAKMPATAIKQQSESTMGHDMSGMNPELHMSAMNGKGTQIEFIPTVPGKYEFYCTIAGHKEAGMVGTLVVK